MIELELRIKAKKLRKNLTDEEKILWSKLKDYQAFPGRFRRQHPIDRYIVDFYSRKAMLVVELDGGQHADEKNQSYDLRRTRFLGSKGLKVLRFWNHEIRKELNNTLEIIWSECDARMYPK